MSIEKNMNTRIQHKHDIEANWLKATNFTPLVGEIVVYDPDGNYDYPRIKIGDGKTNINSLPFIKDGMSPIATVSQTGTGAVISITDKDGTTTATITNGKDGKDGADGQDGYTPQKGIDYFDGQPGKDGADGAPGEKGDTGATGAQGEPGKDGADGKDGTSATHSWNGTVLTITSASGTSSADLKGEKGDKGDTGAQGIPGEKGDKGDTGLAGYTPVKGTDYWTDTDKTDMLNDVLAALPTWNGGSY